MDRKQSGGENRRIDGEPVDPGRSRVTEEEFRRRPPSAEDEYFRAEEWRRFHPEEIHEEPKAKWKLVETGAELVGRWGKFVRSVFRRFDSDWRP
jgi:hypothetical protein